VNQDLVANIDVAATFLQIAGVPIPDRMPGNSFLPLLKGSTPPDWRTAFYYHYYEFPAFHHVRPHYGIITTNYTLVHFYKPDAAVERLANIRPAMIPDDYWELFDREKDPGEMRSVFGSPAFADVQTKLMQKVSRLRTQFKEPAQDDPKAFWQCKRRLKNRGLFTQWCRQLFCWSRFRRNRFIRGRG